MAGKRVSGSITVYLTLVFVLILSLIAVSLEAAAAAALRSRAEAALASGMESALADYYRPLFDKYGIFALDLGYGDTRANTPELEKRVSGYAKVNSGGCEVTSCRVTGTVPVTADGGRYFISQAVEAEKITMTEGLLESLGERLGLIAGQSDVSTVLTKKTELEEELAGIDIYTAELMGLIDGVEIDTGLILEGRGIYRIRSTFVKRFMVGSTDSISVGINCPKIYEKLKGKYSNPVEKTAELSLLAGEYAALLAETEAKEAEIAPFREELELLTEAIMQAEDDELKELRAAAEELDERVSGMEAELAKIRAKASLSGRECGNLSEDLKTLYLETLSCLKETEIAAGSALELTESLRPKVESFEQLLGSMEGIIDEETLGQLGESVTSMKEYVGLGNSNTADFETIRATALSDRQLLDGNLAVEILDFPGQTSEAAAKWSRQLAVLAERMKAFSYDGMFFDYASFEAAAAEDIMLEGINGFVLEPLSEIWLDFLLEDAGSLSEAELNTFLLPILDGKEEAEETAGNTDDTMFETLCGVLRNGISQLYDKAVFDMYLHDRFNSYANTDRMRASVLKYEQEYLLCGNTNDRVNLAGAMAQLLMLRMISAGLFTFTDSDTTARAGAAAQAIAGFTGLPFLVAIVKYLILTVWAFEQAVVETAAIARGKKVPVLTSKESFCIKLGELLSFSKELTALKAGEFKEGGPSLSYEEYLYALLLVRKNETLAGRALDLIQENIRYEYGGSFLICNCIVGFEAEAGFSSGAMYLTNFPGRGKDRSIRGYSVNVSARKSY